MTRSQAEFSRSKRKRDIEICGEEGEPGGKTNRNSNNTLLKEVFKKRGAFITKVILNLFDSFIFTSMLLEENLVISSPVRRSEAGGEGREKEFYLLLHIPAIFEFYTFIINFKIHFFLKKFLGVQCGTISPDAVVLSESHTFPTHS